MPPPSPSTARETQFRRPGRCTGGRQRAALRPDVCDRDTHAPGCGPAQALSLPPVLPAQGQPWGLEALAGARCRSGTAQADPGATAGSDPVLATQRVTRVFCFCRLCNGDAHTILQPGKCALA